MNKIPALCLSAALFALGLAPAPAFEGEMKLGRAPIDVRDTHSLQSGARAFINYCLNCHAAGLMRYNRMRDLGLTDDQIKDNLLFTAEKVGQLMDIAMTREDARQWFGTVPPDLSVIARSRGADWLYTYLLSFYRDPASANGWNNLVFNRVAMPHALWQLQGDSVLDVREFKSKEEAEAAQNQSRAFALVEEAAPQAGAKEAPRFLLKTTRIDRPGSMTQIQYDETVRDLVNYLVWMSEPNQVFRKQLGIVVVFFCAILIFITWFLYKEFWKDVH
ncbi:MAG: hypothetical protein A3I00_08345 [Betaproteobacteria bacterium RIFCSPLOWO2_02_FULL_64_12]|nr:MAG: hypothetical protein A3I00_08345 [Betaproteobacteria bacterium RIFCSPLOWO2_02_FULL_64_12]